MPLFKVKNQTADAGRITEYVEAESASEAIRLVVAAYKTVTDENILSVKMVNDGVLRDEA